ncbi:hypothetical protein VRB95_00565 [Erwinia aphidicola]|uniref:hypothetical protein n=1 Tax=Erwinia aphidicola TaxID=68334 RepID=UPI0030CEE9DD
MNENLPVPAIWTLSSVILFSRRLFLCRRFYDLLTDSLNSGGKNLAACRSQPLFRDVQIVTRRAALIWDVASKETPRNWLRVAVQRAAEDGVHIKQLLMGHKRLVNTEVYTKIFALDVTPDLAFSLPVDEARRLLAIPAQDSF